VCVCVCVKFNNMIEITRYFRKDEWMFKEKYKVSFLAL